MAELKETTKVAGNLELSEKDQEMIQACRDGGVGRTVDQSLLDRYHAAREAEYTIETSYGSCRFVMYWPSEKKNLPLYVNVHGGGFVKGMREQDTVFARNICENIGCAVADIDYTPAPGMRFPGQIYQTYDVIRYLASHSNEFGIDPEHIAAGGHSAGGSIVAAVAILAAEKKEFSLRLQILDYAGFDLYTQPRLKKNAYINKRVPPEKAEFYNRMYLDESQKLDPLASPLWAPDEMLAGLPEALVIACGTDTFLDEDVRYAQRLVNLGIPVTVKVFLHSNHGFTVQRKDEFEFAETIIFRTLKNTLF